MSQSLLLILVSKFFLGITLAAPIGPVSLEMIKRGLTKGFLASFSIRCGGVLGNILCLMISLTGLTALMQVPRVFQALTFVGSLLLIYMGGRTWRQSHKAFSVTLQEEDHKKKSHGLLLGLYLSLANPVAFVFWPSLFAADMDHSVGEGGSEICAAPFLEGALPNLMIFVGILTWGAALAFLASLGHKRFSEEKLALVSRVSAALLILFGLKYFLTAVGSFF